MTNRALAAIVAARLHADRRTMLYACATAAAAGLAAPRQLAGPVVFCSALGIVAALLQTPGRHRAVDLCEESAPLFGRELARAKALVPCLVALAGTAGYCAAAWLAGAPDAALAFGVVSCAAIGSALVALGASLREGGARALYVALACVTGIAAYGVARTPLSFWGEACFCAIVAFVALRQYGEALARYDPIP